jgi:Flp pilus assembly pilin Flp
VRYIGRATSDRGSAAVEAGLLVAGIAMAVITGAALLSGEIETLLRSALVVVSGG